MNFEKKMDPSDSDEQRTVYSLGPGWFYIVAPAGAVLADHVHEEAERLWILTGRGRMQVGENAAPVEAMSEVNIPPHAYHKLVVEEDMTFIEQRIAVSPEAA